MNLLAVREGQRRSLIAARALGIVKLLRVSPFLFCFLLAALIVTTTCGEQPTAAAASRACSDVLGVHDDLDLGIAARTGHSDTVGVWSVVSSTLDADLGFSPAAVQLGRAIIVLGGATTRPNREAREIMAAANANAGAGLYAKRIESSRRSPTSTTTSISGSIGERESSRHATSGRTSDTPGRQEQELASDRVRWEAYTATPAAMPLYTFVTAYTGRAINLLDPETGLAQTPENKARLTFPVIGPASTVRVGSALYALGFCNVLPLYVDVRLLRQSHGELTDAQQEDRRAIRHYLYSVQRLTLRDPDATDASRPTYSHPISDSGRVSGSVINDRRRCGSASGDRLNKVMEVDVHTSALPTFAALRFNASCVASPVGGRIFIMGGVDALSGEDITTAAQYDVRTGVFTDAVWSLGKPLVSRCVTANSELLLYDCGGRHTINASGDTAAVVAAAAAVNGSGKDGSEGNSAAEEQMLRRSYDTLSVVDPPGGLPWCAFLKPLAPPLGDRLCSSLSACFPENNRKRLPRPAPPAFTHTAPHLVVHGRNVLLLGAKDDANATYRTIHLWRDVQTPLKHFERFTGLLSPERRFAAVAAVPLVNVVRLFLVGGLVPPPAGDAMRVAADVFYIDVPVWSATRQVALHGLMYGPELVDGGSCNDNSGGIGRVATAGATGRAAAPTATTHDNVSAPATSAQTRARELKATPVGAYDVLPYNISVGFHLSSPLADQCHGIEKHPTACRLALCTSPSCDGPFLVLPPLGPDNTRRVETNPFRIAKTWARWIGLGDGGVGRHKDSQRGLPSRTDGFVVGPVRLIGSRETGLTVVALLHEGQWQETPVALRLPATTSTAARAQSHVYVCFSTTAGAVAMRSNGVGNGSASDGLWRPTPSATRKASGTVATTAAPANDLSPTSRGGDVTRDEGSGLHAAGARRLPPTSNDATNGKERVENQYHGGRAVPCVSSFYVPLNGAHPFLLRDVGADHADRGGRVRSDAASLLVFVVVAACLHLAAFVAFRVYRERFGTDPHYLFAGRSRQRGPGDSDRDNGNDSRSGRGRPSSHPESGSAMPRLRPITRGHPLGQHSWLSRMLDRLDTGSEVTHVVIVADDSPDGGDERTADGGSGGGEGSPPLERRETGAEFTGDGFD